MILHKSVIVTIPREGLKRFKRTSAELPLARAEIERLKSQYFMKKAAIMVEFEMA